MPAVKVAYVKLLSWFLWIGYKKNPGTRSYRLCMKMYNCEHTKKEKGTLVCRAACRLPNIEIYDEKLLCLCAC